MANIKKTLTMEYSLREAIRGLRTINPVDYVDVPRDMYHLFLERMVAQQAMSRYRWENLPNGIASWLVEQMLYIRGSIAGFKNLSRKGGRVMDGQPEGVFYILPFAVDKGINVYGLPNGIHPLPYAGKMPSTAETYKSRALIVDATGDFNPNAEAVLLFDSVPQFNGSFYICRAAYNQVIIHELAEIMARLKINIITTTKKVWIEVPDAKTQKVVECELASAFGTDKPFVVTTTAWKTSTLDTNIDINMQDLWETFHSYAALLNESMGIANGGVFEKKERKIQAEQAPQIAETSLIEDDGLYQRETFIKNCYLLWPDMKWTVKEVDEEGTITEKECTWRDVKVFSVQQERADAAAQDAAENTAEGEAEGEDEGENDNADS